ncbi:MAG: hypothetical protein ACTHU0_00260 [Kofleriaceae bacterium]
MRKRASVAMAVGLVVGCGKADHDAQSTAAAPSHGTAKERATSTIEIPAGLSPAHRAAAEQARDALLAACANTPLDRNEFKDVSLTTSNASGYLKDRFDWDLIVTIALVYKEGLDQRRGGHRVTFDMGAGKRPGIVTRKSQGIQLCGFTGRARGVRSDKPCDPDGAEDCILDVPALKALDAARPPAVVESQRTAPVAWCFGHGFDPPPFWTCTSTEKACKKARAAEKREENGDYKVRTECSRTESLYCFAAEIGRIVCAPDAAACTTSRKEWTNSGTATPCEVATSANLDASTRTEP